MTDLLQCFTKVTYTFGLYVVVFWCEVSKIKSNFWKY